MYGPDILARTLTEVRRFGDKKLHRGQYHSRSDHHSKVACWSIMFDLLVTSSLLRSHVTTGKVNFGLNHPMSDWKNQRSKDLDLVIATPGGKVGKIEFADLVDKYGILLTQAEQKVLSDLPVLRAAPVGSVLMALEAKAAMTAFQKARPRLYDELNSSHQTVHGATAQAIAVGLAMINAAPSFMSPIKNKLGMDEPAPELTIENQPLEASRTVAKVKELPRRTTSSEQGFDALGIVVVECQNDGTPVTVRTTAPAPGPADDYVYDQMIRRIENLYASTFSHI